MHELQYDDSTLPERAMAQQRVTGRVFDAIPFEPAGDLSTILAAYRCGLEHLLAIRNELMLWIGRIIMANPSDSSSRKLAAAEPPRARSDRLILSGHLLDASVVGGPRDGVIRRLKNQLRDYCAQIVKDLFRALNKDCYRAVAASAEVLRIDFRRDAFVLELLKRPNAISPAEKIERRVKGLPDLVPEPKPCAGMDILVGSITRLSESFIERFTPIEDWAKNSPTFVRPEMLLLSGERFNHLREDDGKLVPSNHIPEPRKVLALLLGDSVLAWWYESDLEINPPPKVQQRRRIHLNKTTAILLAFAAFMKSMYWLLKCLFEFFLRWGKLP